jgi:hypothetical protein
VTLEGRKVKKEGQGGSKEGQDGRKERKDIKREGRKEGREVTSGEERIVAKKGRKGRRRKEESGVLGE